MPAEQAVADGQAAGLVHVKSVLKMIDIRVAVVDELGIHDGDGLTGIVADQNAFLITGEGAVEDHEAGARGGILIPDPGSVASQRVGDLRAGK